MVVAISTQGILSKANQMGMEPWTSQMVQYTRASSLTVLKTIKVRLGTKMGTSTQVNLDMGKLMAREQLSKQTASS